MSDYEASKIRLIMELRKQGISNTLVLSAIERIPRQNFVPEAFKHQAYDNIALPIDQARRVVGRELTDEERKQYHMDVLEPLR